MREIGSHLELFVDDWLIDRIDRDSLRLRLHPPVPQEVALTLDTPWEGPLSHYGVLMQTADDFRLYYRGWRAAGAPAFTCVALSHDGVRWERHRLGLI